LKRADLSRVKLGLLMNAGGGVSIREAGCQPDIAAQAYEAIIVLLSKPFEIVQIESGRAFSQRN
jgi:hypothetical protein